MLKTKLLICFLLILFDFINLVDFRKLLYSFLLSKRNKRGAKKIHRKQTLKDRLTLSYINVYTDYNKEFKFFQKCYTVYSCSIIPQYLILIIANLLSLSYTFMLGGFFFITKVIIAIVLRSQFSSNRISKFDKRFTKH